MKGTKFNSTIAENLLYSLSLYTDKKKSYAEIILTNEIPPGVIFRPDELQLCHPDELSHPDNIHPWT